MQKIEEFLAARPTALIHHYANAAAAINIIQTKTLWATRAQHLNDSTEMLHSRAWLIAEFTKRNRRSAAEILSGVQAPSPSPKKGFDANAVGEILVTGQNFYPPVFIVSFSEEDNLLSQWRAYCTDGNGYSLGFDGSTFSHDSVNSPLLLVKCVYAEAEKQDLCSALVQSWDEQTCETSQAMTSFIRNSLAVMAAVKHPSFQEEREWRVVSVFPPTAPNPRKFRSGRHGIVPYIEIPTEPQMPLRRVRIGPNSDSGAAKSAVLDLLGTLGIGEQVEIVLSDSPFRR